MTIEEEKMRYECLKSPTVQDIQRIERLFKQLTTKNAGPSFQRFAHVTNEQNSDIVVARRPNGLIVGIATIVFVETLTERFAHVGDVVVDENFRGQQIAENLMRQLHDLARMEDAEFIQLTSKPHRTAALQLYEKLGYAKPDTVYLRCPVPKPS